MTRKRVKIVARDKLVSLREKIKQILDFRYY
jgi:hypothetical protein